MIGGRQKCRPFLLGDTMKRKVTYLVKNMDTLIKEILIHTKDIKTQSELFKRRSELIEIVEKMQIKYDKIIKDIKEDIDNEE
jgi:hypothetical protein